MQRIFLFVFIFLLSLILLFLVLCFPLPPPLHFVFLDLLFLLFSIAFLFLLIVHLVFLCDPSSSYSSIPLPPCPLSCLPPHPCSSSGSHLVLHFFSILLFPFTILSVIGNLLPRLLSFSFASSLFPYYRLSPLSPIPIFSHFLLTGLFSSFYPFIFSHLLTSSSVPPSIFQALYPLFILKPHTFSDFHLSQKSTHSSSSSV